MNPLWRTNMRDFFANLFKCTSETMVERIKSPIAGAFVFSWLFINWKSVLILLFSDAQIESKINSISEYITFWSFGYPLLFAIGYCVLIPLITLTIEWALRKVSIASIKLAYMKKNTGLIQKKESEKLRADADIAYERQKTDSEKEIQEMRESITASKEREGILVKEKEEAISEKNNLLKSMDSMKKEVSSLYAELDEIKKENYLLKDRIEKNKIYLDGVNNVGLMNGEYFNLPSESYKHDIIDATGIKENVSMANVMSDIYLQDKIMSIPDIKNIIPSVKSSVIKSITFKQFLNALNFEQLSSFRNSVLF